MQLGSFRHTTARHMKPCSSCRRGLRSERQLLVPADSHRWHRHDNSIYLDRIPSHPTFRQLTAILHCCYDRKKSVHSITYFADPVTFPTAAN